MRIQVENTDGSEVYAVLSEGSDYMLTVTNAAGIILPETGGTGIALYTVAGMLLLCTAGLLLVLKQRRMN